VLDDSAVHPEDVAAYLRDMIEELTRLASDAGYGDLAYCLDVARYEALRLTKDSMNGLGEPCAAGRLHN
jgi:hypothetical protein